MFEYGEAVLVRPVVHYFGEYEDGDVLLPCRLWCKKVVTCLKTQNVSLVSISAKKKMMNLGFAHGQIQAPRASFPSNTVVSDMFSIGM